MPKALICLFSFAYGANLIRMLYSGNHMRTRTLAERQAEPHAHVYFLDSIGSGLKPSIWPDPSLHVGVVALG